MIRVVKKLYPYYHGICNCGAVLECSQSDYEKIYVGDEPYAYQWGIKCPCCGNYLYKTHMELVYSEVCYE